MTTNDETEPETETEVRSKNTPAITDYRHRCRKKQRNENLRDDNFKNGQLIFLLLPLLTINFFSTSTNNFDKCITFLIFNI